MPVSNLAGYVLVLLLGFVAGWLLRPISTPVPVMESAEQAEIRSAPSTHDKTNFVARVIHPSETLIPDSEENQNSEQTAGPNELKTFAEFLDFVQDKDARELHNHSEMISKLYSDPEFIDQLLAGYLESSDEKIKQRLRHTIVRAMYDDNSNIESNILEKIRGGTDTSDWLGLLSQIGVNQESSLQILSDQLPQLYEEQDIVSAIGAVSANHKWMYDPISRELRGKITDQIAQYTDSTAPEMRKTVLSSLANFPRDTGEALMLQALDDPSEDIRRSALRAMMRTKVKSEELKNRLLSTVKNETLSLESRTLSYYALSQYELKGENYDTVREIGLNIREQQKNSAQ